MAVRSKRLAHGVATAAAVTVYTVPSGHTTILKSIYFFNPTTGAATTFFVAAVIAGASRGLQRWQGLGAGDSFNTQDWVVLEEGDSITVQTNPVSAVQFLISGAELVG